MRGENADEGPTQVPRDEAERICIQEGLDALEAGRVQDFDDFDREFRRRNGIRADAKIYCLDETHRSDCRPL
jgi:hypothetical protein